MRRTHVALALLPIAAFTLAACSEPTVAASTPPSSSSVAPATTTTTTPPPSVSSSPTVHPPASGTTKPATAPTCRPADLKAGPGTKSNGASTFTVTTAAKNTGKSPCVLQGYPQVAISGLPPATGDWPHKQLTVTKVGPSYPVTLVPGDGALVTLTFNQCRAGQAPTRGPVLLLGVPDTLTAVTMEDGGDLVECGDTVQATAFEAHLP